jgi:hypothetical protein
MDYFRKDFFSVIISPFYCHVRRLCKSFLQPKFVL